MSDIIRAILKKLLNLMAVLVIVLGMLPAMSMTALASTGSGTEADPYIVTDYEELRSLMKNAPAYYGATRYIKLGADVSFDQNADGYELWCGDSRRVDLDLNGHAISRLGVSTDAIFMVSGTLTIRDSAGGGTVTSNLAGGRGLVLYGADGDIIIEGGTFQANYGYVAGITGNLTVNGGTFISKDTTSFFIFGGSLTMNGGHVSNLASRGYSIILNSDVDVRLCCLTADQKISYYYEGSSFVSCIPWSSNMTQGTYGDYDISPDKETGMIEIVKDYFTPEGSGTEEDPYIIGTKDTILWRMFQCAPKDETAPTIYIKLGADINDCSGLSIGNERSNINLDLNGHTLHFGTEKVSVQRGSLTIGDSVGDGKLKNNSIYGLLGVGRDGRLTINGGSYYAMSDTNTDTRRYVLTGGGNASVTINGGAFYGYADPDSKAWGIFNFHSDEGEEMTVVINDGQFYNNAWDSGTNGNVIVYNRLVNMTLAGLMVEGRIVKKNDTEATGILSDIPSTSILALYGENIREGNNDVLTVDENTGWIKIIRNIPISSVNITGVTAPKVGETVDFSATVNTAGAVKAGVDWYDWTDNRTLSAGKTFQADHTYMVAVTLNALDGYAFNTTNDTFDIRVNGKEGFLWLASDKSVQCCYSFDAIFPVPVITKQPESDLTITEGEGFTLHVEADYATSYRWFYDDGSFHELNNQYLFVEKGTQKTQTLKLNYYDYDSQDGYFYCQIGGPGGYVTTDRVQINVLPVTYDLWINSQQATSENKRLFTGVDTISARYTPYRNRILSGLLDITRGTTGTETASDGTQIPAGSGIYYYLPAGTEKELLFTMASNLDYDCDAKIGGDTSRYEYLSYGIRTNPNNDVSFRILGDPGKGDTLSITASKSAFYAKKVTLEDCTVNINGAITSVPTEVKNADLNINGAIPLSLTKPTQTISVYGDSTMTLQGKTKAAMFYESSNAANQLLYPVGSQVYVGASEDGSDAVLWTGAELPVWSNYKYIRVDTNDSRKPFQLAQLTMSSKPAAGGALPYVALTSSTLKEYMDEDSVTYTWYMKDNLSTPLEHTTDTFKAGTSYRLYVDVDANDGYCFPEGVYTRLSVTDGGIEYGTISENTGSHLRYYVDFKIEGEATGVTVSGSATSFNNTIDPVTILLIKSGETTAAYKTMVLGNSENYNIDGVTSGTYILRVMKNNHVTREYTVDVGTEAVTQDVKIHLKGDVTGDGRVNAVDLSRIKAHITLSKQITDTYQLQCANVADSGDTVNAVDLSRVKAHISLTKPLW